MYVQKCRKQKVFHIGSNSSCWQHIHRHYAVYQEHCAEQGLTEHHHAIPRTIVRARNQTKKEEKEGQQTLNGTFQKVSKPSEFLWDTILKAVAVFVVCDDQV